MKTVEFKVYKYTDGKYRVESSDIRYWYRKGFYADFIDSENIYSVLEDIAVKCADDNVEATFRFVYI